jgi:hypothetical protein
MAKKHMNQPNNSHRLQHLVKEIPHCIAALFLSQLPLDGAHIRKTIVPNTAGYSLHHGLPFRFSS